MGGADWAAWVAVRRWSGRGAHRQRALRQTGRLPRRQEITIGGFRATRLYFRDWDRQLRQPILIATTTR